MKHQIDNVILELRGVSKAFGPTRALTNVDFQLRKGRSMPWLVKTGRENPR